MVAQSERAEKQERPEESSGQDRSASPDRPAAEVRQPEPGVQRGQQEDERERVGRDDEQSDHDKTKQGRGRAGEFLRRRDRPPPRSKPCADNHPAEPAQEGDPDQGHHRPLCCRRTVQGQRDSRRLRPEAEQGEEFEQHRDPEPEPEPAAVAPERGCERDVTAAAAREEIDCREEERSERGDQDELDRPAGQHAWPEVNVTRRTGRELGARVEPAQELLRCTAELVQADSVQPRGLVRERRRRPLVAARQGQGRYAVCQQRPLLMQREWESKVDQLA